MGQGGDGYTTYIVDGEYAILNATADSAMRSRYTRVLGPLLGPNDIASVTIVKAAEAAKRFGTCPGVVVFVITTKSHTWHPYGAHRR